MTKTTATVESFTSALSHEPADKRIEILRLVGDSGSISQAARDAGVSYKAAWQAIDTLTNLAGVVLVERAVGGTGGGGASITLAGRKLLLMADLLHKNRSDVFASFNARFNARELMLPKAMPMLSGMGLRTSMRNQLPCTVEKLEVKGHVVRVHLQIGLGAKLVSRITKASAELLSLKKGQQVLALCKATAVAVTADAITASSTRSGHGQILHGRATRVSRSKAGDEVSVQLEAGLQLVGFAASGSRLKVNAAVSAQLDESAVVIALTI